MERIVATVMPGTQRANGEHAPDSGVMSELQRYVGSTVQAVEQFAKYLGENDFNTIRRDAEQRIQERPMAAVLVGIGIGIVVGKLLKNR